MSLVKILGLDLGGSTGWAIIDYDFATAATTGIRCGSFQLKLHASDSRGVQLLRFQERLEPLLADVDFVVWEAIAGHFQRAATPIVLGHLEGIVLATTTMHLKRAESIHNGTWVKVLTGTAHHPKGERKNVVQAALRARFPRLPASLPSDVYDAIGVALGWAMVDRGRCTARLF